MSMEYVSVAELERVEARLSRQIEQLHQTQLLLIKELAAVRTAASFGEPGLRALRMGKSFLEKEYFPAVEEEQLDKDPEQEETEGLLL